MAKSKNHTAHNQGHKNHRNGIKKAKRYQTPSMKGVDPKFLRNLKYVRKGNIKAVREKRRAAAKALESEKMET